MARRAVLAASLLATSAFAVGCLFPSFDGMEGPATEDKSGQAAADDSPNAARGPQQKQKETKPDASIEPAADGGGGVAVSADASRAGLARSVVCGSTSCDVATSFCCAGPFDAECRRNGSDSSLCGEIHCDGKADCPGGQVCCGFAGETKCQAQCGLADVQVCDPASPECPSSEPNCRPALVFTTAISLSVCMP